MKLSIIIVNYKVKYFLEQCLLSLRQATKGIASEVFVVDNDSQDDSIEYLKPLFPEVYFIANQENVGFARANNQAIRLSKGEFVLLLNPDTLLGEDVLSDVLNFMIIHPDAGGVGVKMIDGQGKFLPESKRSLPTPWVSFCKIFGLSKLFPLSPVFGKYALGYLDKDQIHSIEILAGAFMMLRRDTLEKTGLLDEDFFMYGEDIDLSYRITQAGYKNYYMPRRILHYKGESTPKHTIRYVKIFYEAMDIFFKKHNPHSSFFYAVLIRLAIFVRACMAGLYRLGAYICKPFSGFQKTDARNVLIYASSDSCPDICRLFKYNKADENLFTYPDTDSRIDGLRDFVQKNMISTIVLSDSRICFSDMLNLMEELGSEGIEFRIHTNQSSTVVSSNQFYLTPDYASK